jgi:pimeloyl-ACP methyl ester carboxylesterase
VHGISKNVLCATYPVWEDRVQQAGRKIGLNIVILTALQADKAEPVLVFGGGPGQAITEETPSYAMYQRLRAHHDIVLVDQRGTGQSNPLDCDFYGHPPDLQKVAKGSFQADATRACREHLEKVADLRLYTTAPGMDDIDEVRQWLGYGRVNIAGGSYGSLAAQVYLRRHGEHVRSAVLEAVEPLDELNPLHSAWAGQRAVDILFAKCRADPACESAYPHLRQEFQSVFDRVRQGVEVDVHMRDGRTARVHPSVLGLAEGLRHFLYSDDGRNFPVLVHRAAEGDPAPLVQIAINAEIDIDRILSMGLLLSVSCAETIPYIDDATLARETANTFLGDVRVKQQRAACREWVRGPVPKDVHELVRSTVPALLLSGARDAVTPPSFGERVARQLPNSLHLVFPESSHGNFGSCALKVIADFIDRGSVEGLDTSCIAQQKPPQFTVTPSNAK